MKANELVKKYGIEHSKDVANGWITNYENTNLDDLKRLVESWELVEKHGGLISARKYLKFLRSSVDIGLYHGLGDVDYKTEIPLIEQAIADVESCTEAGKRLEVK